MGIYSPPSPVVSTRLPGDRRVSFTFSALPVPALDTHDQEELSACYWEYCEIRSDNLAAASTLRLNWDDLNAAAELCLEIVNACPIASFVATAKRFRRSAARARSASLSITKSSTTSGAVSARKTGCSSRR